MCRVKGGVCQIGIQGEHIASIINHHNAANLFQCQMDQAR